MTTKRVTVRGADLAVDELGPNDGLPMIWGHGLTQSRAIEDALGWLDYRALAEATRLVRYDARGHGESETTLDNEGYSWAELARDQLALADALGIDRYVCAGASMGCGTALHAAVQEPERIDRLALVIPPTAWETRDAQAGLWEKSAGILEAKGVEFLIEARSKLPLPDPFKEVAGYREIGDADTRAWDPARLAQVFRGATSANFPSRDAISTIGCPTLILAWTGDAVHPVDTAEALHGLITGSEVVFASTRDEVATWTDRIVEFIK